MLRLKVGKSCPPGWVLTLSRKGNIVPVRKLEQKPVGVALAQLVRGRIARDNGRGGWWMENSVDPELTAVSAKYFREDL